MEQGRGLAQLPSFARRALCVAGLRGDLVKKVPDAKLADIRRLVLSDISMNQKGRDLLALLPGGISEKVARKAAGKLQRIFEGLEMTGNRDFTIFPAEYSDQLPREVMERVERILATNFRDLVAGFDFNSILGRSLYFDLESPLNIRHTVIDQIKLKGVTFNADEPLDPFVFDLPLIIEFGPDGRVEKQEVERKEPFMAMSSEAALREFNSMKRPFELGGPVECPLAFGLFPQTSFKGKAVGFNIQGMQGSEVDLREALARLVGKGAPNKEKDSYHIQVFPDKVKENSERIMRLFADLGHADRTVQDMGVIRRFSHPGNILVTDDQRIFISDFESGTFIDGMAPIQQLAYRANEIRQAFHNWVMFTTPYLFADLDRLFGIDAVKVYLLGYFHDLERADFGLNIYDFLDFRRGDPINKMLSSLHLGNDLQINPLFSSLFKVIRMKDGIKFPSP